MSEHVTLAEAATYLGVSKATLRNWDKAGKLTAIRDPINDYRLYSLKELKSLNAQFSLFESDLPSSGGSVMSARDVKRLIAKLHSLLRDTDGNSSLLERFDELSKMLFLGMMAARDDRTAAALSDVEGEISDYAEGLRREYARLVSETGLQAPAAFARLRGSDRAIHVCGRALANVDFAHSDVDVKGLAYEELIRRTFDKTDNQQFFTPAPVVEFIVDLLGTAEGDMCDPASGTGGFAVEIVKRLRGPSSITMLEIDERLAWTAGLNVLLHGGRNVRSVCLPNGGSLGEAANGYDATFDLIVTNPPFGSDFTDVDALASYRLGAGRTSRRRGILFVERCWRMLREGGKLAIILDEGVLNLPHAQDVRRFILDTFSVEAVISLPESAFMPYANVNSTILLLRKGRHDPLRLTFFGRSERIGRRLNGDEDVLYASDGSARLNSDLAGIVEAWRAGPDGGSGDLERVYWASVPPDAHDNPDLRLDFRFHHPSREEATRRLADAIWPLRPISELCDEIKDTLIPAKEMPDTVILYTGLAHIEARTGRAVQEPTPTNALKSAVKRYEPGDLVFARMRPNLRKVALMNFAEGGYVSPECLVLRPIREPDGKPRFEPALLAALLRSDLVFGQVTHLIAGIGRPRLSGSSIKRAQIPCPPPSEQATLQAHFERELGSAAILRKEAQRQAAEADNLEQRAVEHIAAALATA